MSDLTARARELIDKSYAGDYDAWDTLKSEAPALVADLTAALERVEKLAERRYVTADMLRSALRGNE